MSDPAEEMEATQEEAAEEASAAEESPEFDPDVEAALSRYLLALADDELITGHRLSEWTGLGPIIEEDIAFSSIAQDELGHCMAWLDLRQKVEPETDPDELNFQREPEEFTNAKLCELPRNEYDFSLVRQTLYDIAEQAKMDALAESEWEDLAGTARKLKQEEKYHLAHGRSMTDKLSRATEESRKRISDCFDELFPYALGLFEPVKGEELLVEEGLTESSEELRETFLDRVVELVEDTPLELPAEKKGGEWLLAVEPVTGGRRGEHTEHLEQLLDAMQKLQREHPGVEW